MKKTLIFIGLSFFTFSCATEENCITDYLNYKIKIIEANVEIGGNKVEDIVLKDEMKKALQKIDELGILSKSDIEKSRLNDYEKKRLINLSDTINPTFIEEYKLYVVDFYQKEILANKVCFDRLKTLAVKTSENTVDIYLTADESSILPYVYYSVGDSAYILENRTDFPVSLKLDSLKFDKRHEPVKSDGSIFGFYMIPTPKGDSIFTIKKSEIIDAY